jgi:hypothetical protein
MASTGSNSSVQESEVAPARADIVVALTSFNDVGTIETVARGVQVGLDRLAATASTRCIVADAGSTDGTREAAADLLGADALIEIASATGSQRPEMPYHGQPQRAVLLQKVLQAAGRLEAKACAVVDANRQSAEPELIERLLAPVLTDGVDYVSPYYGRHVNEGAITRGIVYPLFRALYGARLRQPSASEFGCSAALLAHYLQQDFWDYEGATASIDLWLAVEAVCAEFTVGETVLNTRATPRGGARDLSTTVAQVVGALFADVEPRADVWQRVRGSVEVPVVGEIAAGAGEAPPLNLEALRRAFRLGYRELREIWTWVLPPRTILELRKLADAPAARFDLDDRLWATIIYDFALGYGLRVMPRDHLLRSLTPLYSGWLASFARPLQRAAPAQVEARVEELCVAFEAEKRYLISRWRWPERLR